MLSTPSQYLANDHDRLDDLFRRATLDTSQIDLALYEQFRKGLLRHISIEEKIVFPLIKRQQGNASHHDIERLRLDHSAIVALLVPTPNASVVATLTAILTKHNAVEEENGGVYAILDDLVGQEAQVILGQFQSAPEVPTHPTKPVEQVIDATRRALARSGYTLIDTKS